MNTKQAFYRGRTLPGQSIKQSTCASDPITFDTNLNIFMPVLTHLISQC